MRWNRRQGRSLMVEVIAIVGRFTPRSTTPESRNGVDADTLLDVLAEIDATLPAIRPKIKILQAPTHLSGVEVTLISTHPTYLAAPKAPRLPATC